MKIVITGGHFSPALSVIEALPKDTEILVLGRKYVFEGEKSISLEYQICQNKNIPFRQIRAGRFQRKLTKHTIPSLLRFPLGIFDAISILRDYKPDVVLSFGGYISLPVSFVCYLLGIPLVIHEQVQKSGLSNKIASLFAKKICVSFKSSEIYFPKGKVVLTGNPVRKEVFEVIKKIDLPEGKVIYITGGSGGSHFINGIIYEIAKDLLSKYVLIHQTGDSKEFNDFEKLNILKNSLPKELGEKYILKKHIFPDEIGFVLKSCQLVVGRSGVNTICELLALSKPSVLIPLAHGQSNEQLDNAKLIKRTGMGEYLEQINVNGKILEEKIDYVIKNIETYLAKKNDAKKYYFPDASDKIVSVIKLIADEKNKEKG